MDRLLHFNDRFKLPGVKLLGNIVWDRVGQPSVDFAVLSTGAPGDGWVICPWTERNGDWTRRRETRLCVIAPDVDGLLWRVTATSFSGGGTAHGPRDTYPAGHHVMAVCVDRTLRFYQTGCFNGMLPPDLVEEWT